MDVLDSDGLTVSNATATYDSAFLNNLYPGWRWPQAPYKNLTFENITLTDTAASSIQMPIASANQVSNEDIVLSNVTAVINKWAGAGLPLPAFAGLGNSISVAISELDNGSRIVGSDVSGLQVTLQASPATVTAGIATELTWTSKDATGCTGAGAWGGAMSAGGSRLVQEASAGNYNFTLNCQNASNSSSVAMPLVVN
jgi:hypothetical protein